MDVLEFAARHRLSKRDDLLLRAKRLDRVELFATNSELSRKIKNRARDVMGEYHRLSAFLRFTAYPEMLLFTEVDLVHHTEDMLMNHFTYRYPSFVIALFSKKILYIDTKRSEIKRMVKEFDDNISAIDWTRRFLRGIITERLSTDNWRESYWNTFYDSQYIAQRKNLALASKFMPQKFTKQAHMSYESKTMQKIKKGELSSLDRYMK